MWANFCCAALSWREMQRIRRRHWEYELDDEKHHEWSRLRILPRIGMRQHSEPAYFRMLYSFVSYRADT